MQASTLNLHNGHSQTRRISKYHPGRGKHVVTKQSAAKPQCIWCVCYSPTHGTL